VPHGNKDGYISRKRRDERRNQPLTTSRQREAALRNIKTAAVAARQERTLTHWPERLAQPRRGMRPIARTEKTRRA
jgi:hypothetical protein